jgi:hypothetical protein
VSAEPDFLSVQDVLLRHDDQIARYGGSDGVRDPRDIAETVGQVATAAASVP